jgi:hypothetical protein
MTSAGGRPDTGAHLTGARRRRERGHVICHEPRSAGTRDRDTESERLKQVLEQAESATPAISEISESATNFESRFAVVQRPWTPAWLWPSVLRLTR